MLSCFVYYLKNADGYTCDFSRSGVSANCFGVCGADGIILSSLAKHSLPCFVNIDSARIYRKSLARRREMWFHARSSDIVAHVRRISVLLATLPFFHLLEIWFLS